METQGTPIGSTNQGLKNTTDPAARNPVSESAGTVASDSLAAESYNAGGEFSSNRNAAPSGAPGASSTLNTTDTSAARKIDPSSSDDFQGEGQSYPEGSGGQPSFSGSTNTQGYYGGPSGSGSGTESGSGSGNSGGASSGSQGFEAKNVSSRDIGGASTSGEDKTFSSSKTTRSGNSYGNDNSSSGSSGNNTSSGNTNSGSGSAGGNGSGNSSADTAPNYVADVYLADTNKPKGANLTEDENLSGKRIDDYEIGGKNDPGRAALQSFENSNAKVSTGQGSTQRDIEGENVYEQLRDEGA